MVIAGTVKDSGDANAGGCGADTELESCLDGFDVEGNALSAFELLDAFVYIADKLVAMSQEFDGAVDGFGSVVIDAERYDLIEELLVFWRKTGIHRISPTLTTTDEV